MPELRVWSLPVVNGHGVTLTVHGQVALLNTGDLRADIVDDVWFALRTPGYPVEMTRSQMLALRDLLDEALEVLVDEHDMHWRPEGGDDGQ